MDLLRPRFTVALWDLQLPSSLPDNLQISNEEHGGCLHGIVFCLEILCMICATLAGDSPG